MGFFNREVKTWQERTAKIQAIFLISCLVIILLTATYLLRDLVTMFVFALLVNYLLYRLVNFLTRFLKFKGLVIFLTLAGILSCFVTLGNYLYPLVVEQITILQSNLPLIESNLDNISMKLFGNNLSNIIASYIDCLSEKINYQNFYGYISSLLLSSINILTAFIITLITSFYLLLDGNKVWSLFTSLFPPHYEEHLEEIKIRIDSNLNALVLGQFKLASLTALVMFSTYLIIGSKYATLLGSLQMIEFIPVFGTWIAIVPSVLLIAATSGINAATTVLITYLVYTQIIRDHILAPRIMGNAFGVHPLAVIFGLLTGIKIFGLVGIIVSLPLIAIVSAIINYTVHRYCSK